MARSFTSQDLVALPRLNAAESVVLATELITSTRAGARGTTGRSRSWAARATSLTWRSVYRYDPDSHTPPALVEPLLLTAVIGAGVSTCAPTEGPL
jgi:hypothetical protein